MKQFPKPEVVFAGTVHYGSGAFAGTGPSGGKPRVMAVGPRGTFVKYGIDPQGRAIQESRKKIQRKTECHVRPIYPR